MRYTEEDIRKAFQAGMEKGAHQSYYDAPLDENEFIEKLNPDYKDVKDFLELEETEFDDVSFKQGNVVKIHFEVLCQLMKDYHQRQVSDTKNSKQ
tara:strand:- start:1837 stop:2121 length:285 start_codon:yes stop_codon:yes gene_type:complete